MPDDMDRLAADQEESDSLMMRAVAEVSERRGVDYDPPHPLDGLDTESLASFNLKQFRTALGVSQQQIADRLAEHRAAGHHDVRLSQTQIAKIERGERPWRLNELVAIAVALGVELGEFLKGQPATGDAGMQVMAAKLRYQNAEANEEDAREALRAAVRRTHEAANALLKVAARHEIMDQEVVNILTHRGMRQYWVEDAEKEAEPSSSTLEERQNWAGQFMAEEWHRLVEEETGHPPTEEENGQWKGMSK
ncbi:helix-turn-helix domain-containing protein [Streptomyces sp. NBC_00289]|uniref:helix-turn-helix domain-containing protein n=1 Tax=Streptomyces sp. NBC_00289 TaxID=2975703 RepID=UPI00324E3139